MNVNTHTRIIYELRYDSVSVTVTHYVPPDSPERDLKDGDVIDFEFSNKSGKAVVVKVVHRGLFDRSIILQPKNVK